MITMRYIVHKCDLAREEESFKCGVVAEVVLYSDHLAAMEEKDKEIAALKKLLEHHETVEIEGCLYYVPLPVPEYIAVLKDEIALNAKMLAHQCDLARQAETERDALKAENETLKQNIEMHWQRHEEMKAERDRLTALIQSDEVARKVAKTYSSFYPDVREAAIDDYRAEILKEAT